MKKIILLIALFFALTSTAHGADIVRYVNLDSSPGGDGTTNDTTGATRAYATWNEWQTGEAQDLVTGGNTMTVYFTGAADGSGDSGIPDIDGWTTNATTNKITIAGHPTSGRGCHEGKWDTAYYHISDNADIIDIEENGVTISCIQVNNTGTTNFRDGFISSTMAAGGTNIVMDKIVTHKTGTGNTGRCFFLNAGNIDSARVTNSNCDGWDITGDIAFRSQTAAVSFYNNTCDTAEICYSDAGFDNFVGNIAQNCTGNCFDGTFTGTNSNNLSSDATAPGSGSVISTALTFVNAAGFDFHLASSDTAAIDAGTTIGSFSDDIDGDTRPSGAAWDIGADEYIAAGSPATPSNRHLFFP